MNAGIQGLAADIFKMALVRLDRDLEAEELASRLVLQVHDEVIVEVAPGEEDDVRRLTESALTGAADLDVPLDDLRGDGSELGRRPRAERPRPGAGREPSWPAGTLHGLPAGTGGGATHIPRTDPGAVLRVQVAPVARSMYPMADAARTSLLSPEAMGSFDAEGNYTPRTIVDDDLGDADLEKAMGDSIIEFDDGDVIEGTVVKIDRDEVLLDIGFKSEGVIPARELSIRNDVDPAEIVSLGDHVEALVLQKEDKEGRLVLSKKRAQYERAWTTIERRRTTARWCRVRSSRSSRAA